MTVFPLLAGTPFFTGYATASDVPVTYPIGLASHGYFIDLQQYRRRTLPALRPPSDVGQEPGENSLNTEGYWRRTQTDWSLGAGQESFDNEDSSRRRFLSSKGVNIWTPNELTLHYSTALRASSAATNLKILQVGAYFYWIAGAVVKHTTDPSATSPTFTTVTTTGIGTITGIATDGTNVYICDGAKIMKSAIGASSMADFGALTPDRLFFANGRLIGMDANVVYEIVAAGTSVAIKTHDNTSFAWNSAVGAPNGIYISGNSGDRNEVYFVGITVSTGALAVPFHAMNLPYGETLNSIEHYGGFILLGTSKGFRVAAINEVSNGLAHGPLVTITGGVNDFDFQGQYAWFTWTNYDGTSTGLGRINLGEFSEPLVPAYASDLMATTQGSALSVASFADKRYVAISGVGFYGQATTRVASGTLAGGWVRFGTVERKVVSSLDFRHATLAGSVSATIEADDGSMTNPVESANVGTVGPATPLSLGQFSAEMFRVNLTLTRSSVDTTTGPTLRRWTVRAIATPFRTEEIVLPILMSTDTDIAEGVEGGYDTLAEFRFLKQLETSRDVVRYQEGDSTYSVYVDGVAVQPAAWTTANRFFDGVISVRLLTVETTS